MNTHTIMVTMKRSDCGYEYGCAYESSYEYGYEHEHEYGYAYGPCRLFTLFVFVGLGRILLGAR